MKPLSQLLLALLTLLLTACGVAKDRVRFEGKLSGINDAQIFIYSDEGGFEGIDTIHIADGSFVYERKLIKPVLATILYPNYTQTSVILEPGKVIKLKGEAARVGEAEITGSDENALLTEFRQSVSGKPQTATILAATDFIEANSETMAAVSVFKTYFTKSEKTDPQEALRLLTLLRQKQPQNYVVRYLWSFYQPIFSTGAGEKLPAFEAKTTAGGTVSAAQYAGKPLAIIGYAGWSTESQAFLRQFRQEVERRGKQCEVLLISFDVDKASVTRQLATLHVDYPMVCDRKAFNSPLVTKLGLRYVPSVMTVNSKGCIVQRDVTDLTKLRWDF